VLLLELTNVRTSFIDLMSRVFQSSLDKFAVVFIVDIVIDSRSKQEHVEHLRNVQRTLEDHNLYARLKKYEF